MKRDFDFLCSLPVLACFDGEEDPSGDGTGGDGGGDGGIPPDPTHIETRLKHAEEEAKVAREEADRKSAEARQAANVAAKAKEKAFNQEDLNTFLADDRRRHQEKYRKLEGAYEEMLADKNLANDQRSKFEAELQDLQKSFRTIEQQQEYERKQERIRFSQEMAGYKEAATKWEHMYKDSVIHRSLQDAAVSAGAFNPSQVVNLLSPMTQMRPIVDENGVELEDKMDPKVDFPDIDEKTGESITTLRTPQEAVQRMKELSEHHGNLFRANVVSGIGSGAATGGVTSGEGSRIDVTKLTAEQYRKMRKENPGALGLRR